MKANQFRVVMEVEDFDRSVKFYEESLELERIVDWDRADGKGVLFSFGGNSMIALRGAAEGQPSLNSPEKNFILIIQADDVDVLYEKWAGTDLEIEGEPEDLIWGRVLTLKDPDGLSIQFFSEL